MHKDDFSQYAEMMFDNATLEEKQPNVLAYVKKLGWNTFKRNKKY